MLFQNRLAVFANVIIQCCFFAYYLFLLNNMKGHCIIIVKRYCTLVQCILFITHNKMENVRLLVILHITFSHLFLVSTSRYDYLFFENFELSKDLFVKEQNLVRELTISRRNLYNNIKALTSGIDNISQHHPDSHPGDIILLSHFSSASMNRTMWRPPKTRRIIFILRLFNR